MYNAIMIDILNFVNFQAELGNNKNLVVWLYTKWKMFSDSIAIETEIVCWKVVCLLLSVCMVQELVQTGPASKSAQIELFVTNFDVPQFDTCCNISIYFRKGV